MGRYGNVKMWKCQPGFILSLDVVGIEFGFILQHRPSPVGEGKRVGLKI